MKLTRLHQAGFIIESPIGARIGFDFGSGSNLDDISRLKPDIVFVSHQHPDHFDRDLIDGLAVPVVGPKSLVKQLAFARHYGLGPCDSFSFADVIVTAIQVNHGPISASIEHFGYLLKILNRTIFFMADSKRFVKPPVAFDTVLIPVGGNKVFTPQEAADYLSSISFAGTIIPIHTEIAAIEGSRSEFIELVGNGQMVFDLQPGQSADI
ncbi:MBL fold metallo-hydrolase [Gordonia sp. ABSL11-1]|uniref:MBL fold metallo-hydrolase n=1 Tax=Gordonia sp. ABSL11-1 TaxID=3053924 RepID=UPI00257269D5|nr:MBL fold metallo-hydrolase [Gordonia sp. ABSL11-1]MDL9944553.1 MBL fold metallo-hydrolase [Gordonia sp. ABSL11-1]